MNLLLLLSAIFSALCGVGIGPRAPLATTMAERSVAVSAIAGVPRTATHRPVAAIPSIRHVATMVASVALSLAAIEPAWAIRRRE